MTRFFILMICLCWSCQDVSVPKPKAFLSLDYPKANYQNIEPQLGMLLLTISSVV